MTLLTAVAGAMAPSSAYAAISGFGDFSDFTVNQADTGSAPTVSNGAILLTPGTREDRSIFYNTPQDITQFTVSFTYQAIGSYHSTQGFCFVLQNSAAGASDMGGYVFGYNSFPGKSLAVSFESGNYSGYSANGVPGGGSLSTSPVNLTSGNPINVTLTYNGSFLQESLQDTKTLASYSTSYLISTKFQTVLGGSTAYVGLTAANPSYFNSTQTFSNFQFKSVPEPTSLSILAMGSVLALRRRRRQAC